MIRYLTGDLFQADVDALAHGVNTQGKMSAGIAAQFRDNFPSMYADYLERCRTGRLSLGTGYMFHNPHSSSPHVINLVTQNSLAAARMIDVAASFQWLANNWQSLDIGSVAMPRIGTGLGRLPWEQVQFELERYLGRSDLEVRVYSL